MGWIADQFDSRAASQSTESQGQSSSQGFEVKAEDTWTKLMEGFRQDVEEFQRLNGDAEFKQISNLSCRISNSVAHVAAVVTERADGATTRVLPHESENRSLVLFDRGDEIVVQAAEEGIRFLLVSGKPIEEPVAWYGPIVMNTEAELQRAFADLRNGTFIG